MGKEKRVKEEGVYIVDYARIAAVEYVDVS